MNDTDGATPGPSPVDSVEGRRNFQAIAQARFVTRRIARIVDEQAKQEGLDPLAHQALIQVYGAAEGSIQVNDLAERLDIVPAFASRLVRELEDKGLVQRRRSERDRRVTLVQGTGLAAEILTRIDEQVHVHVAYFQRQLSESERIAALRIFAFYVGMNLEERPLRRIAAPGAAHR